MWSKFDEGWKRKGGVEVGEKWRRSRSAADDRPVVGKSSTGRRMGRRQIQERGEERKGEGKKMSDGAEVMNAKDDLNEANNKLFIG